MSQESNVKRDSNAIICQISDDIVQLLSLFLGSSIVSDYLLKQSFVK